MAEDDRILLARLAEYVRPYPEKVLARTLGCDERTAKHFRSGTSWPNARHWRLIVQAFGRDVLAAVFEPEINDTLARLRREERQLEERLNEIRRRRRSAAGDLAEPEERRFEALDRAPLEPDNLDLFASRDHAPNTSGVASESLGRIQMRVAQAHADYTAAKQQWPRNRKAIDDAWRAFRAARCEQISAEIGR